MRRQGSRAFEFRLGQAGLLELPERIREFVVQLCGIRKILEAGFHYANAIRKVLFFQEGSGNKKVKFFVLGSECSGLLKGFESFLRFLIARVSLSK